MSFNLKIAKHNIKNSRKSLVYSSKYHIHEKKVKHVKFLNRTIVNLLQINPFITLYSYTDNTNSIISPFTKKNNVLFSNLKFSKTKRLIEKHFFLHKYISKTNILYKNIFYLVLKQKSTKLVSVKANSKLVQLSNFENYLLELKKTYAHFFLKTRFSKLFFQNYLIKSPKKSNDFLINFEISLKKSVVFNLFNLLNIMHFLNFHLIFFMQKKNYLNSTKKHI